MKAGSCVGWPSGWLRWCRAARPGAGADLRLVVRCGLVILSRFDVIGGRGRQNGCEEDLGEVLAVQCNRPHC
jgi:hypothetical protein